MKVGVVRFRPVAAAWLLVAAALAAPAAPAAAQASFPPAGALRAEFWTDLDGVPQSGDPWPLPLAVAASRLAEEAAWVFAGQVWGFEFEWTPLDRTRHIEESFSMKPSGSIPKGDPRLAPEDSRVEGQRLLAYVSYDPTSSEAGLIASYARSPWKSAQGTGMGDYLRGYQGRRLAYEDAARAAIRDLLRGLEPNKPRRVKGRIVFASTPRIAVADGTYKVEARFRIEVTEVLEYGLY